MKYLILLVFLALSGCQTTSYSHVQVASGYPPGICEEIGQVIGNATTYKDAKEQAVEDMRFQAARRNGNYIRLVAISAHGTAARGVAYKCP